MRLHLAVLGLLLVTGCTAGSRTSAGSPGPTGTQTSAGSAGPTDSAGPTGQTTTVGQPAGNPPSTPPASAAPTRPAKPANPATSRVVIRPVTAAGRPAAGYSAVPGPPGTVDCTVPIGDASPVAVDDGIVECSPAAAYAVACWPTSTVRSVLCYRDPWSRRLTVLHTDGPVAVPAAGRTPSPLGLLLADGTRCWLRIGGAWGTLDGHPELYGTYGCDHQLAVWGLARADGIDRSTPAWTVRIAPMSGHGALRTTTVRAAYYVGTAATA
ncbi:MAG TPA: hypothetical protein VFU36_08920 [Jatrophihabitans sp.]|nr:hypothetical protein [Jatrophihabitans sp.]